MAFAPKAACQLRSETARLSCLRALLHTPVHASIVQLCVTPWLTIKRTGPLLTALGIGQSHHARPRFVVGLAGQGADGNVHCLPYLGKGFVTSADALKMLTKRRLHF